MLINIDSETEVVIDSQEFPKLKDVKRDDPVTILETKARVKENMSGKITLILEKMEFETKNSADKELDRLKKPIDSGLETADNISGDNFF